jgi:tripartite-type tricarboxylate transporter receptor subunit TctC
MDIHWARRAMGGFLLASVLLGASACADADDTFPHRGPIRLMVGSAPGGGGDIVARMVVQYLTGTLGQSIVIENRPGAAGNIAANLVAKSPADGYTVLFAFTGHVINPGLYSNIPFDTVKDFKPITMLATNQTILAVGTALPIHSVKELISYARQNPKKLAMGGLIGSSQYLGGELFKSMAGVEILTVPYKGNSESLNALLAGQIQVMFNTISVVGPQIKAGRLRALAVTGSERSALVPDLPTVAQAGVPGYSSVGWYGFVVPAKTPDAVVDLIYQKTEEALKNPDLRKRMLSLGYEPVDVNPKKFDAFIREEIPRWTAVIQQAHIAVNPS